MTDPSNQDTGHPSHPMPHANPGETLTLEADAGDRQRLRAALDQTRGFLLVAGLTEEERRADALLAEMNETATTEPLEITEAAAVRAVAALSTYRSYLLDEERDVKAAAAVEETIRSFAEQDPLLAEVAE